jgi:hypothetical protein
MAEHDPTSQPTQPESPPDSEGRETPRPPIAEALDGLSQHLKQLTERDASLADHVKGLVQEGTDPVRANQREFLHLVAYAVQDAEKTLAHQISLSPSARAEVTRFASSAPGLENDGMSALLQSTATIGDASLVRDIRSAATEIGRQAYQDTDGIRSQIASLENGVRLAERVPQPGPAPEAPIASDRARASAGASENRETSRPENGEVPKRAPEAERPQDDARAQASAGRVDPRVYQAGPLDGVLSALRGTGASVGSAPWDPAPQPFGERLTAFEAKMRDGRDDIGLRDAERVGRAALDAIEGFRTGEGATVMNRIQSAARSDPEGMSGVLTGMGEGGRYQDLRQQFNNALRDETGFAHAYDQAAEALAKYGEARTGVERIIAHRPDTANLTAKFQQLDAEIGEAAGSTPSRREGKNMIDDISKQAAEIIQRALDAVKIFFTGPGTQASRPGPSPS